MNLSIWLYLTFTLILANLPWLTNRLLILFPLKNKPPYLCLLEWSIYYGLITGLGFLLEKRLNGNIHEQAWEFYVVTLSLFAVLAVPGVVYRYQWRGLVKRYKVE